MTETYNQRTIPVKIKRGQLLSAIFATKHMIKEMEAENRTHLRWDDLLNTLEGALKEYDDKHIDEI